MSSTVVKTYRQKERKKNESCLHSCLLNKLVDFDQTCTETPLRHDHTIKTENEPFLHSISWTNWWVGRTQFSSENIVIFSLIFDRIFAKLAGIQNRCKISDEFKFQPDLRVSIRHTFWCRSYLMNHACYGSEISYMDSSWKNSCHIFFLKRDISLSGVMPLWKKSEWNLVRKISWKVFELESWNLVSW